MMIKNCVYDSDANVIEIEFPESKKQILSVSIIEQSIPMSLTMRGKFVWLLDNEPSTLAELYLSGELESYLEWYEQSQREQEADLLRQFKRHYDSTTARMMAREFMMYDS